MEVEAVTFAGAGAKRGRAKGAGGDAEAPEAKRRALAGTPPAGGGPAAPWAPHPHPASRIYRVSRASGGKDRHSKVYTAKGIRDRRVRLSVATAIQFYDLQDRLGYDQPSKAIEWLIRAAAEAIDRLPSLDAAAGFPAHPASAHAHAAGKEDRLRGATRDAGADDGGGDDEHQQHEQQLTRSGCSSTSETSKGSVLSLSRSESRVKARERARERSAVVARDKDTAKDPAAAKRAAATASAQAASFTELLTGMAAASAAAAAPAENKHQQQSSMVSWGQPTTVSAVTTDYIGFAQPRKGGGHAMAHSFASPAPHLGNIASSIAMAPAAQHFGLASGAVTVASGGGGEPHAAEMTHFSFLQDHFMPVHAAPAAPAAPAGEYNLNISMSSGLMGVNSRGTLQSNSQSHISGHHHQQLQRLSTPLDAPNIPFMFNPVALFSPAAAAAAAVTTPTTAEGQFASFQLWNGFQHADIKEKGKN